MNFNVCIKIQVLIPFYYALYEVHSYTHTKHKHFNNHLSVTNYCWYVIGQICKYKIDNKTNPMPLLYTCFLFIQWWCFHHSSMSGKTVCVRGKCENAWLHKNISKSFASELIYCMTKIVNSDAAWFWTFNSTLHIQ